MDSTFYVTMLLYYRILNFMLMLIFQTMMLFLIFVCAGAFLEAIENLGFDYIASGHYAHVIHPSDENTEAPLLLQLSKEKVLHFTRPPLK